MEMVFEPIRPVPPITTIFIANLPVRSPHAGDCDDFAASCRPRVSSTTRDSSTWSTETRGIPHLLSGRLVKLDRIPVGVVDQDRFATRPDLDVCQRSILSCLGPDADQAPEVIHGLAPVLGPGFQFARRLVESGAARHGKGLRFSLGRSVSVAGPRAALAARRLRR